MQTKVIPVDDVKECKGCGESDPGDNVNLFRAELEIVEPFGQEVATSNRDFAVQKSA